MLFLKRCEIIDLSYGDSNCEIEESKTPKVGLIESGPDFVKTKDGYDYSVLIVLENGTLFSTSYKNIRLIDFDFPPF